MLIAFHDERAGSNLTDYNQSTSITSILRILVLRRHCYSVTRSIGKDRYMYRGVLRA